MMYNVLGGSLSSISLMKMQHPLNHPLSSFQGTISEEASSANGPFFSPAERTQLCKCAAVRITVVYSTSDVQYFLQKLKRARGAPKYFKFKESSSSRWWTSDENIRCSNAGSKFKLSGRQHFSFLAVRTATASVPSRNLRGPSMIQRTPTVLWTR